jgi:hypothetical protein
VTLGANLPHLERDEIAKRLFQVAKRVAQIADEVAALGRRPLAPRGECARRRADDLLLASLGRQLHRGYRLARRRIR